jgi:archaellum biogenesis ATPase FlaH
MGDEQFLDKLNSLSDKGQCFCDKLTPEAHKKNELTIIRSIQKSQMSFKMSSFNNYTKHEIDRSSQKIDHQSK